MRATARALIIITSASLLLVAFASGCYYYSANTVSGYHLGRIDSTEKVIKVKTSAGTVVHFDRGEAELAQLKDSVLTGVAPNGAQIAIPLSEIDNLDVLRLNVPMSVIISGAAVAGGVSVILLLVMSDMHIYK